MSRIFELLRQAAVANEGRANPVEQEVLVAQSAAAAAPAVEAPAIAAFAPKGRASVLAVDDFSREEIAKIVQQLFSPGGVRSVVFAGIDAGSGCSWMTARVAEALAGSVGGAVCLVDANFRSPSLHEMFSVGNHYGFADALRQSGVVRQFTSPLGGNLSLLSCGSTSDQGQALVTVDGLQTRITELRKTFDYVLFDAPALGMSADPIVLGRFTDGLVMVLEANVTHRERARKAAQNVATANVRLLGTVLNKRTFPIPQSIYDRL